MTSPQFVLRTKYPPHPVSEYHGGQGYRDCPNFKCDFSVAINFRGPPAAAVEESKKAFTDIEHYPDQDAWVPRCYLADFLGLDPLQILVGNGSSELIDVLARIFPPGTTWRQGPWDSLYKEYDRACNNAQLVQVPNTDSNADLTILVNPNTPDGNFIEISELDKMIAKDSKSIFIIDESYLFSYGIKWQEQSALSLLSKYEGRVIVIHSWTKVFACPLLRIGSVISSKSIIDRIAQLQAPWSVNGFAQKFLITAIQDKDYFHDMWKLTPEYKQQMRNMLDEIGITYNQKSPLWVPYVFSNFYTEEIAALAEKIAFDAGFPVRNCSSYGAPTYLRFSVRESQYFRELVDAWKSNEELMQKINSAKQ